MYSIFATLLATTLLALGCRATTPPPPLTTTNSTACTLLACGETVEGDCFRLELQRRRCVCKEMFLRVARPTAFRVTFSLSEARKFNDSLFVEDASAAAGSNRLIKKIGRGIEHGRSTVVTMSGLARIRLSSRPQGEQPECVPPAVYRRTPKGRRRYTINVTMTPILCPPVSADLGCGKRLEVEEESVQGTRLSIDCGCLGHRSAIGPALVCTSSGRWSADTAESVCRSSPHPLRLAVIFDVTRSQRRVIPRMLRAYDRLTSYLRRPGDETGDDRHAVVFYTRGVAYSPAEDAQPDDWQRLFARNVGVRRARAHALRKALNILEDWADTDAGNVTSSDGVVLHSPRYSVLIMSSAKQGERSDKPTKRHVKSSKAKLEARLDAEITMLDFTPGGTSSNRLADWLPSDPAELHSFRMGVRSEEIAQLRVMTSLLNSLTSPCIRLSCGRVKRGSCAYIHEGRPRCLNATACPGYRFVHVSPDRELAIQLYSRDLPLITDQLVMRSGIGGAGPVAFRCTETACRTDPSEDFPSLLSLMEGKKSPSFIPNLLTGWTGPETTVQLLPEEKSRPCFDHGHSRGHYISGTLDVVITAPECSTPKAWDVGNGSASLPSTPLIGSAINVSCDAGHIVAEGTSAITYCEKHERYPYQPPVWSQDDEPVCQPIPDGTVTCPLPRLPLYAKLRLPSGGERHFQGVHDVLCERGYDMICGGEYCSHTAITCQADGKWRYPRWENHYCEEINPERLAGFVRRRFDLFNVSSRRTEICEVNTILDKQHSGLHEKEDGELEDVREAETTAAATVTDPVATETVTSAPLLSTSTISNIVNQVFGDAVQLQEDDEGEEEEEEERNALRENAHEGGNGAETADGGGGDGEGVCGFQTRTIQHIGTCMELAFLLDDSKSMGESDFGDALNFTRQIVTIFGNRIRDAPNDGIRVALVTFADGMRVQLSLKNGTDHVRILTVLKNVTRRHGDTNIRRALEQFLEVVVPTARFYCQRLLFIITDGDTNTGGGSSSLKTISTRLIQENGFDVYGIGIKNSRFRRDILESVVSRPVQEYLFVIQSGLFRKVTRALVNLDGVDYSTCGVDNIFDRDPDRPSHHAGPVRPAQYPWMAGIFYNQTGRPLKLICGGSLVKDMSEPNRRAFVLTAAHCVHGNYLKQDLLVRLGDTIYSLNEGTEQDYGVDEILFNRYGPPRPRSPVIRNDIALLKLNRDPVLGPAIRTICLPHKGGRGEETDWNMEIPPETPVVSGGWGWERDVGSDNIHPNLDKMKAINLYTLNTSVCEKVMAAGPSTVCAHDPVNNADTCLGDSGGPLMRRRGSKRGKDDKGTWFVAGVLSYGPSGEESFCNVPGKFGVYTKLDGSMLNWVYRRLGKEI